MKITNQQIGNDIYFYRQSYSFETNKFHPDKLPLIFYCKKIFNPDLPFKQCICGNYFHLDCFIRESTNECWAENCNYNCNNFLDTSQQIQKMMNKSDSDNVNNNMLKKAKSENNNKKGFYQFEYKSSLGRKTERKNDENITNISHDNSLNLSKKSTSFKSVQSINDKFDKNLNIPKKPKSSILGNTYKSQENINREKGQKIIYNVLLEGYNLIENNHVIKYEYENSKNKLSKLDLNTFSTRIENNLFLLYKSNPSSYKNFLQEFNKIKRHSQDLLFQIISGKYTPEQISNFKTDDFLSEEKKKEKEIQKQAQFEKMKIKTETNNVQFSMEKGNLLTKQEVPIETEHHANEYINLNLTRLNSNDKILEKQKQFPNLNVDDNNNLISMETPNKENIKLRLEHMLRQNLDINSLNYFKEKRKNMLMKKAKLMVNQELKKNCAMNNNDNNKENIKDNPEYENMVNEYVNKISFIWI